MEAAEGAITVLFTDVESSTDMRTRLGDEAADQLLRVHEEIVRDRVSHHGGREIKSLGDGFMIAFASPRKAISCAVDIQRALDARNRESPGREIRIKIGINAGEVTEIAGDLMGAAVNAAARIAGKARGGQILVANVVKDLAGVRPDLSYIDRGLYWLKGFPERWRLFEILRRAGGATEELVTITPTIGKTRFVGRESERADLRRFVEQAGAGRGALVLIGGEPGVGKTRFTEEVAEEASSRGMMSFIGHCPETEAGVPYAPVVEIMEATMRGVSRETLRLAFGEAAPELARMVPALRRIFPNLPPPLELPPEQERRYLFNCFTEFVERASHLQPLLFILEDVHWADEPTMLLVQHLAAQLSKMPVLLLATYRDVELDVDKPLARTLEELLRRRLASRINLNRLPRDGVSEMLGALARREAPASLVNAVFAETEGNCFFVEEVFEHLNEEGKLFDDSGAWRTEVQVGEVDVPEGVRLVLGRRLGRLSEGARRALAGAAVIGRNFTFEMVEALGEVSTDVLLDGIEEAHRARLLTSNEDAYQARFTFAHELIRQTLLTGLSLPRRQRLHLRVAEAIERLQGDNAEERATDLAHHLYQAGAAADPEKTVRFLLLSGDRAMAGAAFEDAFKSYERAAGIQPEGDERARADLEVKLGFALRALNRNDEAITHWRKAIDAYAELGDVHAIAEVCTEISQALAWAGFPIESIEFMQRGLAVLGDERTVLKGRLLSFAGAVFGYLGDVETGMTMIDEASTIADDFDDAGLRASAIVSKAIVDYTFMQHSTLVAEAETRADIARAGARLWDLAGYLTLVMWSMYAVGRTDEALVIAEEALSLSDRIGHFVGRLLSVRLTGVMAYRPTGDLAAFEAFAKRDYDMCSAGDVAWITNAHGFRATAELWRGRLDAAHESAVQAFDTDPPGGFNGWAWALLFLIKIYSGRSDDAMKMFADVSDRLPVAGKPATWGSWAILHAAVEGLSLLGEGETAAQLYPLVLETRRTGAILVRVYDVRLTECVAGIAAHAGRSWEAAESHFLEAMRLADTQPIRIEQAESRFFYARMLAERNGAGDRERARELLEAANETYASVGMPWHLERAEALLKSL